MRKAYFFLLLLLCTFFMYGQLNPKDVTIIRDQWGVPHIHGKTDEDAVYGLAWAHAEDDFETLQLPLISAKRLLGRYIGKEGAAIDYVVELLRLEETALSYQQTISPKFRKLVNAYVQAVNAFAEKNPDRVLVKQAFPVDELDLYKAYGLSLAVISGADQTIKHLFDGAMDKLQPSSGNGSNAIAISRKKTTDQQTYLAVNSHQPLEGPVAWYEAHIVSDEGWNMLGGLFPGSPVILHGTNEHLGWAHTVNYPDKIDVFELEINPDDQYQYRLDGEWKKLESEKVKLKVKLLLGIKISVKKEVLWSAFGPTVRNKTGTYAFSLSTLEDIRALEQWYEMNKATDFESFKEALDPIHNPGFNIVYADKSDSIYHIGYAKIPLRKPGYDWKGILPGKESDMISKGYHQLSNLPRNLNPESGFVFNTNNSAFSSSAAGNNPNPMKYDETMGYDVWENNRSARFLQLMQEVETLSYKEFKEIKFDLTLPDSLRYPVDINPLFSADFESSNPKAEAIQQIISGWNKKGVLDEIGPAQATMTYNFLQDKLDIPYRGYYRPSDTEFEEALVKTYDYFEKHFGRIDVPLKDFQFLVRGEKAIPMQGVDDVIASMRSVPYEDGKVKAFQGESYIMLVKYPKSGLPIIETVSPFGASNRPGNKHYSDQMELFVEQRLKPMTLDLEEVRKNAERIYHPE